MVVSNQLVKRQQFGEPPKVHMEIYPTIASRENTARQKNYCSIGLRSLVEYGSGRLTMFTTVLERFMALICLRRHRQFS